MFVFVCNNYAFRRFSCPNQFLECQCYVNYLYVEKISGTILMAMALILINIIQVIILNNIQEVLAIV